ncbi:group II intron reverse transcriptase/maturase, partial [Cohnella sp. GCM10020058]
MNAAKPANDTKVNAQQFQQALSLAAKENPRRRFHALYDKVHRSDILWEAWKRVKGNGGSGGVDGMTIDHIVEVIGEERFVDEIQTTLRDGEYRPL